MGLHEWRPTLALGLVFAAVQFSMTLWGYDLPRAVDWVPLLLMSLTVGVFESIFFRGFVQNRLEASFGPVLGVGTAAALYGLYHFGYGMGLEEIVFLAGLGVVYAVAFRTTRNVLVLWPLLTPLGSLFNNLETGDIVLPWASMVGFGQVLIAMVVVLWLGSRYWKRRPRQMTSEWEDDGSFPTMPSQLTSVGVTSYLDERHVSRVRPHETEGDRQAGMWIADRPKDQTHRR